MLMGLWKSKLWIGTLAVTIFLTVPSQSWAKDIPTSIGRWKLVSGDGFCWMSAKTQTGTTVQIVFTPTFMADQVWLLDHSNAMRIIPKIAPSAVLVDDVALSADASGSFEPVRVLKISDGRLRHALRVGNVAEIFVEGRTRAVLSLAGSGEAMSALSPCVERLDGQKSTPDEAVKPPVAITEPYLLGTWGWGATCSGDEAFILSSGGAYRDGPISGRYSLSGDTILFDEKVLDQGLSEDDISDLLKWHGIDDVAQLLAPHSIEIDYVNRSQLRLRGGQTLLSRC